MPEGCPEPHPGPRGHRATRAVALVPLRALTLAAARLFPAVAVLAAPAETAGAEAGTARSMHAERDSQGKALDSRKFEPGACVEFPPTSGDRKLTVFLDAGHGGIDP